MTTITVPAGWQPLPPGFTLPGVARLLPGGGTEPMIPLCGHAEWTARGWSADCAAPAAYGHPGEFGYDEYSCGIHLTEVAAQYGSEHQS
jgi:hypothetical protein